MATTMELQSPEDRGRTTGRVSTARSSTAPISRDLPRNGEWFRTAGDGGDREQGCRMHDGIESPIGLCDADDFFDKPCSPAMDV